MPDAIVVCISGFAGSGKSTLARRLADALNLRYASGGDGLKMLAIERGYKPGGDEWWETDEGFKFLGERLTNPEFDRDVDRKLLELAKKGGVVIDSWVLPWLYKDGFNIWLKARPEIRAKRISKRSGVPIEEALEMLFKRDRESSELYEKLYGILLGRDFEPFHLVLDTSELDEGGVFRIALQAVKEYFKL
ncbi:MAG: cytidylate kinase family protein [Nitrososphaeria archaeon]|nr:cytidylate kinase family protein [Nitrososphaeria archaeon]MDW8021729.1 cytidylate kinase family protein [Nitrososphaerota archaeon]